MSFGPDFINATLEETPSLEELECRSHIRCLVEAAEGRRRGDAVTPHLPSKDVAL